MNSSYPTEWETHVVLSDGSSAEIRPILPSDRQRLVDFHGRQSAESIYFRYFRHRSELTDKELDHFTQVDYVGRMAFIALIGDRLVAVGRYERLDDHRRAEVAFFVDDDHHGKGLATILLEYLAAAARSVGIEDFVATVLPENYSMLAVFRRAGFKVKTRFDDGVIEVDIDIEVTEEITSAISGRNRRARARSITPLLEPQSVMLVGAGRRPGTLGHLLAVGLTGADSGSGYAGELALVNRRAGEGDLPTAIGGHPLFPSIEEAAESLRGRRPADDEDEDGGPSAIDLAVIAVPVDEVPGVVDRCAAVGVRSLFIVTTGYADAGADGRKLQDRLVEQIRDHGMRMVGPNAFGIVSTDPDVNLKLLYYDVDAAPGSVAIMSESGPLGAAVLRQMAAAGAGVSEFVGIGNQADVDLVDLLDRWATDGRTSSVAFYGEEPTEPKELVASVRATSPAKPVMMLRPSDPALARALTQAGAILVDEVSQLADQAVLADHQPIPVGDRVVIVSNTASVSRLSADACRRNGLTVVVPESAGDVTGSSLLIGDLDTVSFLADSQLEDYERVIVASAVSAEVDAVMVALAPTPIFPADQLRRLLDRVNRAIDKPVVAVALVDRSTLTTRRLPVFTFPEEAARALGRWAEHGRRRAELLAEEAETAEAEQGEDEADGRPPLDRGRFDEMVVRSLNGDDRHTVTLSDDTAEAWVGALDLPVPPFVAVTTPDEAVEAAARIGYPVVLKAAEPERRAVGEAGGTAVDLHTAPGVVAAFDRMRDRLGPAMDRAVVQRLVDVDHQVRIDVVRQPSVGSVLIIGAGGFIARSNPPIAQYILPLERGVAEELAAAAVESLGMSPSVEAPLASLVEQLAEVARLRAVNRVLADPVLVSGAQLMIADIEIELVKVVRDPLSEVRHL